MSRRIALLLGVLCAVGVLLPRTVAAQETVEYYATDALGSVRVVFASNGTVKGRMDFGPYGEQLTTAEGIGQKVFAQITFDGESAMDYAEARMFQLRTGRFNAPDPVRDGLFNPQDWNAYSYARNNPFAFIDPGGTLVQCVESRVQVTVQSSGADSGTFNQTTYLEKNCIDYGDSSGNPIAQNVPTGPPGGGPSTPGGGTGGSGGSGGAGDSPSSPPDVPPGLPPPPGPVSVAQSTAVEPSSERSLWNSFTACAAAQYGFGDGKTPTGLELGKVASEIGALPVFKPLVGLPVIGESSRFTNLTLPGSAWVKIEPAAVEVDRGREV